MERVARRGAIAACYAYGLVSAAVMGHFLLGVPIQLSDSFSNILSVRAGWDDVLAQGFSANAYLRPMLWADLKLVFEASQGDYTPWYRGVHVAQIFAAVLLTLGLVRPRSWPEASTVPLALAALLGMPTFKGTIVEAFPVNTYLTIVLCCLAAANLALAPRPRWYTDVASVLLFASAALTVESGLLVWVVVAGAALVGARGISKTGLVASTVLLAGYFVLRFGILHTGAPGLVERSSGFGFAVLDPPELIERFGQQPWLFYLYNVASSLGSVLFAEPRSGVFRFVRALATDELKLAHVVVVAASSLGTALIGTYIWQRRHAWWRREFGRDDQLVAVFCMVLAANALISYPYTKDVIMSAAGAFYAAALAVAARSVLLPAIARPAFVRASLASALAVLLASTWAVRSVNAHLDVRLAAFKERNEWAYEAARIGVRGVAVPAADLRIFQQLRDDAVHGPAPPLLWPQDLRIFDMD